MGRLNRPGQPSAQPQASGTVGSGVVGNTQPPAAPPTTVSDAAAPGQIDQALVLSALTDSAIDQGDRITEVEDKLTEEGFRGLATVDGTRHEDGSFDFSYAGKHYKFNAKGVPSRVGDNA